MTDATTCPICAADGAATIGEKSGYQIARCRRCAHSFVQNLPSADAIAALYERYSYDTQSLEAVPAFVHVILDDRVREFAPYRQTGRLLDVGFGAGTFLRAARDGGWHAQGLELSPLAVDQAVRAGFDVMLGDLLTAPLATGSFDVVVMAEIVEHLPEPAPVVHKARTLLRPGGLLYLTTPHGRGLSGRVIKTAWSMWCPPEHLHLFSRRSIRRMLHEAGFDHIRIAARGLHPHELIARARHPFARSAQPTTSSSRVEQSYRTNEALVSRPWGRVAKRAANRLLDVTSLGDGLVVFATAAR